jgi:hypothetical protein
MGFSRDDSRCPTKDIRAIITNDLSVQFSVRIARTTSKYDFSSPMGRKILSEVAERLSDVTSPRSRESTT